ncbi:head maturation protease, ClpP-related [Clostridium tagluense]|uniref:head maturation protease, ClpP-related n=1 Tax=Clostridium tagluense TaxID=360422 RepID=UPI001CF36A23|nr:head maturation protease, ClpP-related [Clostridium tagluense]MCB2300649.1 Clp protease ClpP [Clostridium tagluense]
MNKFYEFKNIGEKSLDIMLYGEIISGGAENKWDSSDVCFQDFKDALDNIGNAKTINMYINSIGGSVITSQGIVAMLQRVKDKGVIINSYIDGLGASCASFLPMISNNIYAYNSSLLMIHKPMSGAWGNANDMQSTIDILNKMEDSVMLPLYMSKAKEGVTEEQIKDLLAKETWLDSKEMSDLFNIIILEETKDLVACINDKTILNSYKNIPTDLKAKLEKEIIPLVEDKTIQDKEELELLQAKLQLALL